MRNLDVRSYGILTNPSGGYKLRLRASENVAGDSLGDCRTTRGSQSTFNLGLESRLRAPGTFSDPLQYTTLLSNVYSNSCRGALMDRKHPQPWLLPITASSSGSTPSNCH